MIFILSLPAQPGACFYLQLATTYSLLMLDCCVLPETANIKDRADEAEGVKILRRREDVRAGRVLSNSCTTCKVRHSCHSHYYQDFYFGDRACTCLGFRGKAETSPPDSNSP